MNKQQKLKIAQLQLQASEEIERLSEDDKKALERSAEIVTSVCQKLLLTNEQFMLLYLNSIGRMDLLIQYNNKVVDVKTVFKAKPGSKFYHVTKEAATLSEFIVTPEEIQYLVDIGLLMPEVLQQQVHSFDSDTNVWDLVNYFTESSRMVFGQFKSDERESSVTKFGRYRELHEMYPSSFSFKNKLVPGKPATQNEMQELSDIYNDSIDDETHKKIIQYVADNKDQFSFGLRKFIVNKMWEGKLPTTTNTKPKTKLL